MTSTAFVAGDWGTTSCRLYLFESSREKYNVIDVKAGLGVSKLNAMDIEAYFAQLIQPWVDRYDIQQVFLSGMVGSTIGWRVASYGNCPLSVSEQLEHSVFLDSNGLSICILAGVRTLNPLGLPDTMRGEEVQLIGAISALSNPDNAIVILPGTHNKWALIEEGQLSNFFTSYTGELFFVLNEHSILTGRNPLTNVNWASFKCGVDTAKRCDSDLIGLLFSTRAHQLVAPDTFEHDASYLLGLIVGRDIGNGLVAANQFNGGLPQHVVIVGDDKISQTYETALALYNVGCQRLDSTSVAKLAYPLFWQKYQLKRETFDSL